MFVGTTRASTNTGSEEISQDNDEDDMDYEYVHDYMYEEERDDCILDMHSCEDDTSDEESEQTEE